MSEKQIQEIADKSKMIVSGYSFSNRDDIEQTIVLELCKKWKSFGGNGYYEG